MLLPGESLLNAPIMSLQTGTQIAHTKAPIINPENLKIMAYEIDGPLLSERPAYVRTADIRELSAIGMIVDSSDEFILSDDVISLKKIIDLGFVLINMPVIDELKHKLGKVGSYSVDGSSFVIQQLSIKRGIIKSLSDTELLIHRSQIIEINDNHIKVRTTAKKLPPIEESNKLSYINPFRSTNPQTNNDSIND